MTATADGGAGPPSALSGVLARLGTLHAKSCRHIHDQCLDRNGRLDPERLDEHQQAACDLAFCAAELAAADALLSATDDSSDALFPDVATAFGAEAAQSCWQRLLIRHGEIGLTREQLLDLYGSEDFSGAVGPGLDAGFLAEIGSRIVAGGVESLRVGLDADQELARVTFRRFSDDVVAPVAEQIHRQDLDVPESIIQGAAGLGCFGLCIPARFGGLQRNGSGDSLAMVVVTEELSRASLGAAGSLITRPEIVARALLAGGTEAQQRQWLPRLASGELLCSVAVTEPDTGSDVANVKLKATRQADGWLLNGSKTWCTFAGRSGLILVLARSDSRAVPAHKGLSLFLVSKPAAAGHAFEHRQDGGGRLVGKAIPTLGYRGMHSFDLFFEDWFVPTRNLVGEEQGQGRGFYYTMAGFAGGRLQTAARATGVMQAAFEKALGYARERRVFARALADYPLTRVKLARMLATISACRQFSWSVAAALDGGAGQMEASLVKLFSCRAAEWISREAMQIHGGMGYAEETAVSRYFVDARVLSIFEGAEETLALKVIARDLIARAGADSCQALKPCRETRP